MNTSGLSLTPMVGHLPPAEEGVLSRFFSTSRNSYTLFSNNPTKPKTTICKLVLIFLSQFFHNLRRFSNHPNDLSTTQRLGITANLCNSLRFAISTVAPKIFFIFSENGSPV